MTKNEGKLCFCVLVFRNTLSIRTISHISNFKLYRTVYKLKTKYMSTIEK